MSTPLSPGSPVHRALSWAADLISANLLAVLLSLPLLTGGVGLAAAHAVSLDLIDESPASALRSTATVVTKAFPAVTVAWLVEAGLAALLIVEWLAAGALGASTAVVLARAVVAFVALMLALGHVWFWPLLAHRLRLKDQVAVRDLPRLFVASLVSAVARLPRTIGVVIVQALPVVAAAISFDWALRALVWMVLLGVALPAYLAVLATHSTVTPSEPSS